jgi:hypothetical protein
LQVHKQGKTKTGGGQWGVRKWGSCEECLDLSKRIQQEFRQKCYKEASKFILRNIKQDFRTKAERGINKYIASTGQTTNPCKILFGNPEGRDYL